MSQDDRDNNWHLDKKVPISIILALLAQGVGAIWWAGKLEQRVAMVELQVSSSQAQQTQRDERQDRDSAMQWRELHSLIERMDAKLDRLIERQARK